MILHVMRMHNFKEGLKEYFNLIKSIYINLSQLTGHVNSLGAAWRHFYIYKKNARPQDGITC